MAARIDNGEVQLLTRSGLDWTEKYTEIAKALAKLVVASADTDGALCGVGADGVTSFALIQSAGDTGLTVTGPYFPISHFNPAPPRLSSQRDGAAAPMSGHSGGVERAEQTANRLALRGIAGPIRFTLDEISETRRAP